MRKLDLEEPVQIINEQGQIVAIATGKGSEVYWPREAEGESIVELKLPEKEYISHHDTNNGVIVIDGPAYTGRKVAQIVHPGQGEGFIPDIIKE